MNEKMATISSMKTSVTSYLVFRLASTRRSRRGSILRCGGESTVSVRKRLIRKSRGDTKRKDLE